MSSKRIVLQHPSGLMQIIGESETQPPDLLNGGDEGMFNLVAVKRTYYLFKKLMSASDSNKMYHHTSTPSEGP